jgi:hypothetical protein
MGCLAGVLGLLGPGTGQAGKTVKKKKKKRETTRYTPGQSAQSLRCAVLRWPGGPSRFKVEGAVRERKGECGWEWEREREWRP